MYTCIQQKPTRITSGRIPSVKILVQTQLLWFVLQAYTFLNGHMHAFDNHQQHQICGLKQQKQQSVIWYNNKTTLTVQESCCNPGSYWGICSQDVTCLRMWENTHQFSHRVKRTFVLKQQPLTISQIMWKLESWEEIIWLNTMQLIWDHINHSTNICSFNIHPRCGMQKNPKYDTWIYISTQLSPHVNFSSGLWQKLSVPD